MSDTWVRNGELPWVYQSNVNAFNQAEADYSLTLILTDLPDLNLHQSNNGYYS